MQVCCHSARLSSTPSYQVQRKGFSPCPRPLRRLRPPLARHPGASRAPPCLRPFLVEHFINTLTNSFALRRRGVFAPSRRVEGAIGGASSPKNATTQTDRPFESKLNDTSPPAFRSQPRPPIGRQRHDWGGQGPAGREEENGKLFGILDGRRLIVVLSVRCGRPKIRLETRSGSPRIVGNNIFSWNIRSCEGSFVRSGRPFNNRIGSFKAE